MVAKRALVGVAVLCAAALGGAARADELTTLSFQPPATPEPAPRERPVECPVMPDLPDRFAPEWVVQVDPTLWFVGPSGKILLPVTSGTGPGGFTTEGDKIRVNDLDLSSTRLRPAGTLTAASGKWRFSFWGSEYELSRGEVTPDFSGRLGAVAFASGDRLKLDLSFGTYELTAGYRIWEHDFTPDLAKRGSCVESLLTVHLLGGARLYDVEVGAENLSSPARAEASHVFAEPVIGLRAEAIIDNDFSVILQLSAGGLPLNSTTSYSLDVVAAFQWRPTKNIGVQIGWRQLAFDLRDGKGLDKFEYEGRLAGLFTGLVIRF